MLIQYLGTCQNTLDCFKIIICGDDNRLTCLNRASKQIFPAIYGSAPADNDQISRIREFYANPVIHFFLGQLVHDDNSVTTPGLVPICLDQFSKNNESGFVKAQNDNMIVFHHSFNTLGHIGDSTLYAVVDQTNQHSKEEYTNKRGKQH